MKLELETAKNLGGKNKDIKEYCSLLKSTVISKFKDYKIFATWIVCLPLFSSTAALLGFIYIALVTLSSFENTVLVGLHPDEIEPHIPCSCLQYFSLPSELLFE